MIEKNGDSNESYVTAGAGKDSTYAFVGVDMVRIRQALQVMTK